MTTLVKCDVYGCEAGQHEAGELASIPLPGDEVYHRTVIASVYFTDEVVTLLLLAPAVLRDPNFQHRYNYEVSQLALRPHGNLTVLSEHLNIVPAVREYEQNGGDY